MQWSLQKEVSLRHLGITFFFKRGRKVHYVILGYQALCIPQRYGRYTYK